ncbi:VOC family protein [Metaclostridioides mangenotii]|uniref:VOC family protein n=1 Tax=Metaclostridioides mangenotii TaxID=1540 RepID=UPI0004825914|nr:VOC family protein [Clostridioides mangenotii]
MKSQINLITIWTNNIDKMKTFYKEVLGFEIIEDLGGYVEFKNKGVRFAISKRSVMDIYSNDFKEKISGQAFELAFPCKDQDDVDESFTRLVTLGARPISEPQNMPWNQRTALFADPDGNIHEIFADIK